MKKNVGQTLRLVNVTKGLQCLHMSFATLDMCKLGDHQVHAVDGYSLLDVPLVFVFLTWSSHWKVELPHIRLQFPKDP